MWVARAWDYITYNESKDSLPLGEYVRTKPSTAGLVVGVQGKALEEFSSEAATAAILIWNKRSVGRLECQTIAQCYTEFYQRYPSQGGAATEGAERDCRN